LHRVVSINSEFCLLRAVFGDLEFCLLGLFP
jgi:hypothetical protein